MKVRLSAISWLVIRASYFIVVGLTLGILFSVPLSLLHLLLLFVVVFTIPNAYTPLVPALVITNVLFVGIVIFVWGASIQSGNQTVCEGYPEKCLWVEGAITWRGAKTIAVQLVIQVIINAILVLTVYFLGPFFRKKMRSV